LRALSRPADSTQWLVLHNGRSPASRGRHVTCRTASSATQDQWSAQTTACIMHKQQQQSPVAHVAAKHPTTQVLISDMLQNRLTCPPTFPCATLQHMHQITAGLHTVWPNKQGRCTLGYAKWRCRGFWICQKHNACRGLNRHKGQTPQTTTASHVADLTCPPTCSSVHYNTCIKQPACTPCRPNKQGRCTLGYAKWRCRGS
jgi:hypothetical protein